MITNNKEAIEKAEEFLIENLYRFKGKLHILLYELHYDDQKKTWEIILIFCFKYIFSWSNKHYRKIKLNKEGVILSYEPLNKDIFDNE